MLGITNASPKVCAGSEEITIVLWLNSANFMAVEQDVTVLPVPPLPV
jgi:hypothetical protein